MSKLKGFIEVPTADGTMLVRVDAIVSVRFSTDSKKSTIKLQDSESTLKTSLTHAQLVALIIDSQ